MTNRQFLTLIGIALAICVLGTLRMIGTMLN